MAAAAATRCMFLPQSLPGTNRCFGFGNHSGRIIPPLKTNNKRTMLVRNNLFMEIAAAPPGKRMYVGIAAIVVPLLMAIGAFGAGFLLKNNIKKAGIRDAEEMQKLMDDGMEFEEAKAIIFKKIEDEYNESPNFKIRRKRKQVVEKLPSTSDQKQQQQPTMEEN